MTSQAELEEERRLAYVGITRAKRAAVPLARLAPRDVGDGPGVRAVAVPARDPGRADGRPAASGADDGRPRPATWTSSSGRGATSRFGTPVRGGGGGVPAGEWPARRARRRRDVPAVARPRRQARGVRRRRAVRVARAPGPRPGTTTWTADAAAGADAAGRAAAPSRARPVIPGERQFRDGDRVRHARWGDGIVVTSKLTRSDEEVTVAFKDPAVGRKTMLVSLANLELVG